MRVYLKAAILSALILTTISVAAQTPPKAPSPKAVDREVKAAAREANDVKETVQAVNDVVNAFSELRRVIDSVVANDKSKTAGEVHFIFVGIAYSNAELDKMDEELKKANAVTDVQKIQKTGSVTFQFKSNLVPYEIWKDLPRQVQKSYMVHDKDPFNVVLLYKAPPKSKTKN